VLIRLLRSVLLPYRRQVAIVTALLLLQSIANLYLPNLNADIINNGVAKGDTDYIWRIGAIMLGITLVLGVLAIVAVYFASETSMSVGRDVRAAVFDRVQSFSAREMNRFGTASLITRNTNDVQQVQLFLQIALTILVSAPIIAVGGVFMAVREDATLSWLLVVIVPLMAAVIGVLLLRAVPLFRQVQVKIDRLTQVLREQITGVRVVRAFIRVESERARFEVANADLTDTSLRVNRIRLDGTDTRDLPRDAIRRAVGMVLQDSWLFAGTIRDNIAYGKEGATMDEIVAAATAAHVDPFVRTLPDGYDTVLDEDASNISAGQRQLLTIARAFLADPSILVLDEATSNVDTRTEVLIQQAMARLRQGRTSFVIAHRLSTIRNADEIVVMDGGRIVELGDHADLLRKQGFYYDLYQSQFAETVGAEAAGRTNVPLLQPAG
jgi:ABC-type multidrug transport system fused ATPase/permease subunit